MCHTVDVGQRDGGRGKQSCVWADRVVLQILDSGQLIPLSRRHVVFVLSLDARPYTRSSRFVYFDEPAVKKKSSETRATGIAFQGGGGREKAFWHDEVL